MNSDLGEQFTEIYFFLLRNSASSAAERIPGLTGVPNIVFTLDLLSLVLFSADRDGT